MIYCSVRGHTARVARRLCASITEAGARADMMELKEVLHEGLDWDAYDTIVIGAPVIYGGYDKTLLQFVADHRTRLDARPNSFFNVSVVARTPAKATVTGNRYMQKFLELSPWRPRDLEVVAGKVDYPAWPWYAVLMIQLIMKMTHGPTNRDAVIDYTDWDRVAAYGRRLLTL